MPYSTQHRLVEQSQLDDIFAGREKLTRSGSFGDVHKEEDDQSSDSSNEITVHELEGKPVYPPSTATSSQSEIEELQWEIKELETSLFVARKSFDDLMEEFDGLYRVCQTLAEMLKTYQGDRISETQGEETAKIVRETLAKAPPLRTKPDPVSYDEFIKMLEDGGFTWLLEHTKHLNSMDDFAVALTANPEQKRCKVGRPRGKILKKEQTDDLEKRICCMHKGGEDFRRQVFEHGRDPWKCWPPNADEDKEVVTK